MDRNGVLLQLYSRAPAPSRDYYGLTITEEEVILNAWNVSHGPHVFPKRQKCELNDFIDKKYLQNDIEKIFGKHVLIYCLDLSRRDPKLHCLPTRIFLYILRHLATNDVLKLGQTSKIFFELCNRESTWRLLFQNHSKQKLSRLEIMQAEESGWKNALKNNIVLHNLRKNISEVNVLTKTKLKVDKKVSFGGFEKQGDMDPVDEKCKNPFIIPGGALKIPKAYNLKSSNILDRLTTGKSKSGILNNAKVINEPKTQTQNNKLNLNKSNSVNFNIVNNNLGRLEKNVNITNQNLKNVRKTGQKLKL